MIMGILGLIGFIYLMFKLVQEGIENAQMREEARRKGYETYASNQGGLRKVSNNHLCHIYYDQQSKKWEIKDLGK